MTGGALRSLGSDGKPEQRPYAPGYRASTTFAQDILFSEGNFFQAPEGISSQ